MVPESTLQNYPNKTGRVYEHLRESILRKELSSGERLIERDLVQRLGVSSTVVREALARLAKDGLVTLLPYRGAFVTKLSKRDIIEIYELREVVEGLAARWAAERVNEEEIKQLRAFIKSSERFVANTSSYYDALNKFRFHDLIGKMSGNARLYKIIRDFRNQSKLLISSSLARPERAKEAFEEEKKVLEAIINRDPFSAEKYAKEHVRNAKKVILEIYKYTS